MKVFRLAALALVVALTALVRPSSAQEALVTDLSSHLISIESNFTGADILLFGAVGGPAEGERDIIIVVRGPATPVTVRRKARVGGIWVNYDSATLDDVPGYYAVVSTRPIEAIAAPAVLQRLGIGARNLNPEVSDIRVPSGEAQPQDFRSAITRLRTDQSLFQSQPGGVVFLGQSLFRANIALPANVPDGDYSAQVYLFRDGEIAHAQTSRLFVRKAGFERLVFDFAHEQPLLHGIAAVFIAMFAGWAASAIFRSR